MERVKLGKKRTTRDPRTLKFSKYLVDVPALEKQMPRTWNAFRNVESIEKWPVYGNDVLGDCVVAASAHMVETWRANAAGEKTSVADNDIVESYWKASGGSGPAPASYDDYARRDAYYDNGLDPLEYLKQWQHDGIAGHKAGAYVQVDATNPTELRLAAWLTDGLFIGLELPAYLSNDPFAPWTMRTRRLDGEYAPGSWGGHMVNAVYSNPDGGYHVTWGERVRFSWTFLRVYADVIFAVISEDALNKGGLARSGFNYEQLLADLNSIGA